MHNKNIIWNRESQHLISSYFDDVFFYGEDGGLSESRYVFLQGNSLPFRWLGSRSYYIGELGFGTGLNFLVTAAYWQETMPKTSQLHYISLEKHPIPSEQMLKILTEHHYMQSHPYIELLRRYAKMSIHETQTMISLQQDNISLTIYKGDILTALPCFPNSIQAWYLDGFAPAKNPAMWTEQVFTLMRQHSAPQATFATFTSAGCVRRGLQKSGFKVSKTPGFGKKRHRLIGYLQTDNADCIRNSSMGIESCVVIGAGIAGCHVAYALAEKGQHVLLLDRSGIAQGATGNPLGVIMPRLTAAAEDPVYQWYWAAYLKAIQHYSNLKISSWQNTGVLQHCDKPYELIHASNIPASHARAVTAEEATEILGISVDQACIFFPTAGYLDPQEACDAMVTHSHIQTKLRCEVTELCFNENTNKWSLLDSKKNVITSTRHVILASAYDSMRFQQSASLPFVRIRGQLSYLARQDACEISCPFFTQQGYILPTMTDKQILGATFQKQDPLTQVRLSDHQLNIRIWQQLTKKQKASVIGGRVAFRAAMPDRRPVVGRVPNVAVKHQKYPISDQLLYPGLYVTAGHGSRGLLSSALAADMIAAEITQELPPIADHLVEPMAPIRFLLRSLKRY